MTMVLSRCSTSAIRRRLLSASMPSSRALSACHLSLASPVRYIQRSTSLFRLPGRGGISRASSSGSERKLFLRSLPKTSAASAAVRAPPR